MKTNSKIIFSELTAALAARSGLSKAEADTFLREFFNLITDTLADGENVKIKGIGSFKVTTTTPRRSVDVSTGKEIEIPSYRKISFTPDRALAEAVNLPFSAFESVEIDDDFDPKVSDASEDTPEEEETVGIEDIPIFEEPAAPEKETEEPATAEEPLAAEEAAKEVIMTQDYTADETSGPEESFQEDDEPRDKRMKHPFMAGFWCGIASMIILIAIGVGVWYLSLPDRQINSSQAGNEDAVEATIADNTKAAAQLSDTTAAPDTVKPQAPATTPSDQEVYETISNTCFLTTMAKRHYGNYHLWPFIYDANRGLGHPDRIRPGTRIRIPSAASLGIDPADKATIEKAKRRGVEIYAQYKD